jgi:hypothetical protein
MSVPRRVLHVIDSFDLGGGADLSAESHEKS